MKVSEIMANIVQSVDREKSLDKVAGIMKDYDSGCVNVQGGPSSHTMEPRSNAHDLDQVASV